MGKNVIKRYGAGVLFSLMLGSSLNGYSQGLAFDVNAAPKGNKGDKTKCDKLSYSA